MSRIGADHLAREAIVYVRQSTIDQVINNVESRRRQYGLVERARQLGCANVSVIDDDLGRSGSGVCRPGSRSFWRRSAKAGSAQWCRSRLRGWPAMDGDWHTLLEFCGLVGTLIAVSPGVGKTHLAIALGRAAIREGCSVLFVTAPALVASLAKAHAEGRLEERLGFFAKPKLLIVDELGYLPFETNAAHLFFQLVSTPPSRRAWARPTWL